MILHDLLWLKATASDTCFAFSIRTCLIARTQDGDGYRQNTSTRCVSKCDLAVAIKKQIDVPSTVSYPLSKNSRSCLWWARATSMCLQNRPSERTEARGYASGSWREHHWNAVECVPAKRAKHWQLLSLTTAISRCSSYLPAIFQNARAVSATQWLPVSC